MVFCQTKRDADELTLSTAIKQETHVMHGDIPQEKREKVLKVGVSTRQITKMDLYFVL